MSNSRAFRSGSAESGRSTMEGNDAPSDLALDVRTVRSLPEFAQQPDDAEDIGTHGLPRSGVDLRVGLPPGGGAVWLGGEDSPISPKLGHSPPPRPPPRYRREGKAREVGEGLKEAGDDEAMVATYREKPEAPQETAWDAARKIELCVHRLREVRSSSLSGLTGLLSDASASLSPLPPDMEEEPADAEHSMSNGAVDLAAPRLDGASVLADEARRARAQEAKAKEEADSLREGLAKQSVAWREERHLQEASIEGLQAAHTHALHRAAEYQVTIPLLQAKITLLKTDNRELHSLLARRTEEWQTHATDQAALLEAGEVKLAGVELRASDAENRAAASEKVAVRHAVVANEVASKVAGVEERAANIEAEAKRKEGASAAASLAAATELDAEVVKLARDYKELQWRTAALTERCALQQLEIETLREEKYAKRRSRPVSPSMRELVDASPSTRCTAASPLVPVTTAVPGSPLAGSPRGGTPVPMTGSPLSGKAVSKGLPDAGDYGAAVAVHKPKAVAKVLKVLKGDWAEDEDSASGSGALGALRWLVAEESRTEGNVPGYIRHAVAAHSPTPATRSRLPHTAPSACRGRGSAEAIGVHRAGWDQSSLTPPSPPPTPPRRCHIEDGVDRDAEMHGSDARVGCTGRTGQSLPQSSGSSSSPNSASPASRLSTLYSPVPPRTQPAMRSRPMSSPFSVLERLSPTALSLREAGTVGAPVTARAQSFAPSGVRRSAATARDAVLREEVRQQLAKLQAVKEVELGT